MGIVHKIFIFAYFVYGKIEKIKMDLLDAALRRRGAAPGEFFGQRREADTYENDREVRLRLPTFARCGDHIG